MIWAEAIFKIVVAICCTVAFVSWLYFFTKADKILPSEQEKRAKLNDIPTWKSTVVTSTITKDDKEKS